MVGNKIITGIFSLLICSFIYANDTLDGRTTIYDFRYYEAPTYSRMVLDIENEYQHSIRKSGKQIILSIPDAKLLNRTYKRLFYKDSRIKKISLDRRGDILNITYQLKENYGYKTLQLTPNSKYPNHRLVIDITNNKATPKPSLHQYVDKKIIVLDPGHGGEDSGAIGTKNTYEKHINLQIAKKLQAKINKNAKFHAVLSRERDYYVKLTERPKLAQRNKADLFISIHADSALRKSAKGASVYVLSKKGGTTQLAKQLEKTENATDIFEDTEDLIKNDAILNKNMWELAQQNSSTESLKFANIVLKHIGKVTKLHKKQPGHANFVVLKTPAIGSILFESAFLSNIEDERKLATQKYQNQIAQGLYNAIEEYFKE